MSIASGNWSTIRRGKTLGDVNGIFTSTSESELHSRIHVVWYSSFCSCAVTNRSTNFACSFIDTNPTFFNRFRFTTVDGSTVKFFRFPHATWAESWWCNYLFSFSVQSIDNSLDSVINGVLIDKVDNGRGGSRSASSFVRSMSVVPWELRDSVSWIVGNSSSPLSSRSSISGDSSSNVSIVVFLEVLVTSEVGFRVRSIIFIEFRHSSALPDDKRILDNKQWQRRDLPIKMIIARIRLSREPWVTMSPTASFPRAFVETTSSNGTVDTL